MKRRINSFTIFAIFDDIHVVHARWIPSGSNTRSPSSTGMHAFVRNTSHFATFHLGTDCWSCCYEIRCTGLIKSYFTDVNINILVYLFLAGFGQCFVPRLILEAPDM